MGRSYMLFHPHLENIWVTPPTVIETDQAQILMDFHIQADKMAVANQLDFVVVNKQDKKAVVGDVAIWSDMNIKKNKHEKLEKKKVAPRNLTFVATFNTSVQIKVTAKILTRTLGLW